ncbi:MAG: hypothetical protein ACSLE2_05895 [Lysobacterales bacterium]
MTRLLAVLLLVPLLQGCGAERTPAQPVHTSFSATSGLVVEDGRGKTQQLIPDALDVRAVVSPSGRWIAVEEMKLSNLVAVRAFRFSGNRYEEVALPGIKRQWEALAAEAGVAFEDLVNPRVGIEGFGASESTITLLLQADTGRQDRPELVAMVEVPLESDTAVGVKR